MIFLFGTILVTKMDFFNMIFYTETMLYEHVILNSIYFL